ncbi:MAG: DUF805 domain-containing protein [Hyphomicrobium sp.]|nr:DUF805 domain-containing protein [Hyphomicrobium sp.]
MALLFSFDGHIGRGQFWLGYLAVVILAVLIAIIVSVMVPWEDVTVTGADGQPTLDFTSPALTPAWIAYLVYFVVGLWIAIAISIKRFRDRGKSGWWSLIMFITLIGPIWWLIELGFLPGDPGPNTYGPPAVSA